MPRRSARERDALPEAAAGRHVPAGSASDDERSADGLSGSRLRRLGARNCGNWKASTIARSSAPACAWTKPEVRPPVRLQRIAQDEFSLHVEAAGSGYARCGLRAMQKHLDRSTRYTSSGSSRRSPMPEFARCGRTRRRRSGQSPVGGATHRQQAPRRARPSRRCAHASHQLVPGRRWTQGDWPTWKGEHRLEGERVDRGTRELERRGAHPRQCTDPGGGRCPAACGERRSARAEGALPHSNPAR